MKNLKLAFLLVFVLAIIVPGNAKAQATTECDTINISLTIQGVTYTLTSGDVFIRTTPSGNFIRTLSFKIDESNPICDLADPWSYFIGVKIKMTIKGEQVTLIGVATITQGGIVKLHYISNGSGTVFSPGRF